MASRPRTQEKTIEGSSFGFQWFKLDAALQAKGSALAFRVYFDTAEQFWKPHTQPSSSRVRIYSPASGFTAAKNDVVPVYFNPIGKRLEIFQPSPEDEQESHYANVIGFTLDSGFLGRMKTADDDVHGTVDYIIDGTTPPVDVNGFILLHDDQELFPLAVASSRGWAFRNEHLGSTENPYYQIISCDQMCLLARAVINGPLDGPNTTSIAIREFRPLSEAPFGMYPPAPFDSFALNPHKLRAPSSFSVTLGWGLQFGEVEDGYNIIQVDHQTRRLAFGYRIAADKTNLEVLSTECAVQYNAEPTWGPMLPIKDC